MPEIAINDNSVNNFLKNKLCNKEISKLVIDISDPKKTELGLLIAFHFRLSIDLLGENVLCPILMISDFPIETYLNRGYLSQLFITESIFFSTINDAKLVIEHITPLSKNNYFTGFVDRINILPPANTGRHSLANQWGAKILDEVSVANALQSDQSIEQCMHTLYFKFIRSLSYSFNEKTNKNTHNNEIEFIDVSSYNSKVLLIDDEAAKGWGKVLRKIIKVKTTDDFQVIDETTPDYKHLSDSSKKIIEQGKFDIYLLDLRMNGTAEEDGNNPEAFSGMKILKEIKKQNPGNQVIILTASNKAWNLKAVLDAGADGYYIKESPEYRFPTSFSTTNFKDLKYSIELAAYNSYLKIIYNRKKDLLKTLDGIQSIIQGLTSRTNDKICKQILIDDLFSTDTVSEIESQIELSFNLLLNAGKGETSTRGNDVEDNLYAYAYVSTCYIFEVINNQYISTDKTAAQYLARTGSSLNDYDKPSGKRSPHLINDNKVAAWIKVANIHDQILNINDPQFNKDVSKLIDIRNTFIHNKQKINTSTQAKQLSKISQLKDADILNPDGYRLLFDFIIKYISEFTAFFKNKTKNILK